MPDLTLVSHPLCPYVQRAVIALTEKAVPFRRVDIDLAAKPDWFLALSPLGKTPVLCVGDTPVFESAVILEYLEETQPRPLHPADPLARAEHRAWIEVASAILNDVASLYTAPDAAALDSAAARLADRFARVEARLVGPWFDGDAFSLVDAAFAPVFRYLDVLDRIGAFGILDGKPKVGDWRRRLSRRPSVAGAVAPDYPERLLRFLEARGSQISRLVAERPQRVPA